MNKNITPARRLAVAAEALVLTVLLLPLVLLARMVSPGPSQARLGHGIPEPCPAAPVAPLQPETMVVAACASTAPATGITAPSLATMTTVELRRLAQQQGIRNVGGRRCSKARRSDLIAALS